MELAGAGFWEGVWTGSRHRKSGISFKNGTREKVESDCGPPERHCLSRWIFRVFIILPGEGRGVAEGPGGVSERNLGGWAGLNIFYRGRNSHQVMTP